MVDSDDRRPPAMRELLRRIRFIGLRVSWVRYDRTRRGWHVVIRMRDKRSPIECVALQAVLGSDRERETFNLARVMWARREGRRLGNRWNILYEKKILK